MNTRKIFFALFTMAIFVIGACTTDTADDSAYEVGVDKTKITKQEKEGVDKTKITIPGQQGS